VCTCCQNTVAVLPDGRVFAAYRGHTSGEIRDNKYVIFDGTGWSAPVMPRSRNWPARSTTGLLPARPMRSPRL
ncbi:MAG: hypothetical protein IAG10_30370, partial [Planctomycetaceae bacterium]|nr:hypothetical protein [Planctomycetaceae bacterium]